MPETDDQKKRRKIRRDSRSNKDAGPVGYSDEDGNTLEWSGTEKAPYVIVCNEATDPVIIAGDVEGVCLHDDPDTGVRPILTGGHATTLAPPSVSAEDDCVRSWYDLEGRQQVVNPQLSAGEDLIHHVLATVDEPLAVEQHSEDRDTDTALVSNSIIKASPGRLYRVEATLSAATAALRFLHILNRTTAPSGGETPIWRVAVPVGVVDVNLEFPRGLFCDTGIVVAWSTVHLTTTLAAEVAFHTLFK